MSACSILFRYYTSKRASECNCGVKCTVLSEQDCIVDRLLSCLFVLFSAVCLHCPVALQLRRTCRAVRALMKAGQTLLFSSFSISAAAVLSCLPLCGLSLLVSTAAFFLSTAHALRRPHRCSSSLLLSRAGLKTYAGSASQLVRSAGRRKRRAPVVAPLCRFLSPSALSFERRRLCISA